MTDNLVNPHGPQLPRRISGPRVSSESGHVELVSSEVEQAVGISVDNLSAIFVLSAIKGFGPQKFKELQLEGLRPIDIVSGSKLLPTKGKRGDTLRSQLLVNIDEQRPICRERAIRQILTAKKHRALILTYDHVDYPSNVYHSNNPVPLLYVRGSLEPLRNPRAIACVGSRKIREPYASLHNIYSSMACRLGYSIVSGFAVGADAIGHRAALDVHGQTVCVMPCGLDRPFPPEHKMLWEEVLGYPGASVVSEFAFGTAASSLTLRKRNKLIVSFAVGILVSQSSATGGAMNAYRFAREQRKPLATFASDNTPETSGNALIQRDADISATTLPTSEQLGEALERWLRELSSLI
jgi:DNA protecting protein DprA